MAIYSASRYEYIFLLLLLLFCLLFFFLLSISFCIFSSFFFLLSILTSIQCLNIPHPPCTCEMMTKWAQKCKDDSETSNWLNSNTKTCPKCGKVIEKDGMNDKNKNEKKGRKRKGLLVGIQINRGRAGGCNLVTCKCGQYFCWLCGQSTGAAHTWTSIDGHTCGKFKDGEVDTARRSLQRYPIYLDFWVLMLIY